MTGPEHYAESERLIAQANAALSDDVDGRVKMSAHAMLISQAQVHATLALAAATAQTHPTWTETLR